jgi:hypothetical protein
VAGKRRKKREKRVLFPGKRSATRKLELTRTIAYHLETPALRPGKEVSIKKDFFPGLDPGSRAPKGHCLPSRDPGSSAGKRRKKREKREERET